MNSTLTYEVIDLARSQAARFEHQRSVLVFLKPVALGVLRLPYMVAGHLVAKAVDHIARQFAERAVWFRGATSAVQECPRRRPLDPDDEARAYFDKMELHLLGLRREALKTIQLRSKSGRPKSSVGEAMSRLVSAVTELYEEVRAFKGAIQAHDADVSSMTAVAAPNVTESDVCAALDRLHNSE